MKRATLAAAMMLVAALFVTGTTALAAVEPASAIEAREPSLADVGYAAADADETNTQRPLAVPTQYVPDGQVDVPIGQYILAALGAIMATLTTWLTAALNAYFNKKADAARAEMIATWTQRAVNAAANYVEGAAPGLKVSFKVGSEWVERALEQALALFPDLIAANGGEAAQRRRIWSYVQLEAGESVPVAAPVQLEPVRTSTPAGSGVTT